MQINNSTLVRKGKEILKIILKSVLEKVKK
jgi:hypothetical protein